MKSFALPAAASTRRSTPRKPPYAAAAKVFAEKDSGWFSQRTLSEPLRPLPLIGWRGRLVAVALLLFWAMPGMTAESKPPARPNIILVLTDDQGYGDLSYTGNPILKTPHLDAFAQASVRFTDFQVSPTCAPTRAALMTGRHEFRSGVTHTIFERERLSLQATTIAQVLQAAGYATGIFGKWHLGDEDAYQPGRRGFDEVFIHGAGGIGQTYSGSCGDAPGNTYFDPAIRHNGRFVKTRGYCTDVFFTQALDWMDARRKTNSPFFAYISLNAPHSPLQCPEEYVQRYAGQVDTNTARFFGMIANIDDNFGRLLARLDEWGLARDTLVIFLTDNGGTAGVKIFNAGMRGSKATPYLGGTRVPSFWRWPAGFTGGTNCDALTAHLDVFPTFAEIAGAKAPANIALDGRSLVPLLKNPQADWPDRFLFTHVGRWEKGRAEASGFANCSVRNTRFQLVNNQELYDLKTDPGEKQNVITGHPEEVTKLRAAYAQWWREVLPALENENAVGPATNSFKTAYWHQFGGGPAITNATPLPRIRLTADGRGFETEAGQPFVPLGLTYFRPGTGWAPQVWKQFDADATRRDFARMKGLGVNCVRVFLSYGSFLLETNQVSPEGLAKFDQFLEIAEQAGVYVHPTGPDHWEGQPDWAKTDPYADEVVLRATGEFWRQFAARYRGRSVIFAYDLLNEPVVRWNSPLLRAKWNQWLKDKYAHPAKLAQAWGDTNSIPAWGAFPVPPKEDCAGCARLLDFQHFREDLADEWTRRQVATIKTADPQALVTVGLIQWSVPSLLAAGWRYSAFRPERQARLVDFMEIHFYPLARGFYEYRVTDEARNLAYLEGVVREVARWGKPVVIAEFGWYGGGQPTFGNYAFATEELQAQWCRKLLETTAGLACGWLNWGLYDHPEAKDVTQFTGLLTSDGELKAWGRQFQQLSERYGDRKLTAPPLGARPALDWELCITSAAEGAKYRTQYLEAWKAEQK